MKKGKGKGKKEDLRQTIKDLFKEKDQELYFYQVIQTNHEAQEIDFKESFYEILKNHLKNDDSLRNHESSMYNPMNNATHTSKKLCEKSKNLINPDICHRKDK